MQTISYAEDKLVKRMRGTIPVIITCPHGGSEKPASVTERTAANNLAGCPAVLAGPDVWTLPIAEKIVEKIVELYALLPYAVLARFERKYIDANRSGDCAFVSAAAQPFYDEYHNRIRGYAEQMLTENAGRGFLFDIHGFPADRFTPAPDICFGTANGATLQPWLRHTDLYFRHGLHGHLVSARHRSPAGQSVRWIVQPNNSTEAENINGGFTVREHGQRLSAIQIEIVRTVRDDSVKRSFIAEDLATSIVNFTRRHTPY